MISGTNSYWLWTSTIKILKVIRNQPERKVLLQIEPHGLRVEKDGIILIDWSDGHKSKYNPFNLRRACPCAMCKGEPGVFGKYYSPQFIQTNSNVQPEEIVSIGRYGLKIIWSDQHDAGIYTYEYLRNLCECESCKRS